MEPRSKPRCLLTCAVALLCAVLAYGQAGNQGSVEGLILDPTGAAIPGAALQARNLDTAAQFTTASGAEGFFRFPVLPLGAYELVASHPGFAVLKLNPVVVTVGARVNLALRLSVAAHAESIVVRGETPLLEATRTQLSATIDSRSVAELPVNGRDFTNIILLTPGVTTDARGGLSFAGQRAMNRLLVDGVDQNDSFFDQPLGGEGFSNRGATNYHFSQDAVQEFQVNPNSYSAELGRASGGVANVVTKSGDNQLRGSAYWFYRDRSLNANDPVNKLNGLPKDPFHFNQFGGTLGGPLLRDRLFFFFNYEGLRSKVSNPVAFNLPPGFALSPNLVVAGFQQLALDYLAPRASSWAGPFTQGVYLAKSDWRISEAHRLSGRWSRQRLTTSGGTGPQVSLEASNTGELNNDILAGALTSTLGTRTVNIVQFAYLRGLNFFAPNSINPLADIFEGGQRVLIVGRAANTPQETRTQRIQVWDTLSLLRGRHTWKVGADVLLDWNRHVNAQNFSGNHRFQSLESFGRSLAGAPAPALGERYLQSFSREGTPGAIVFPNVHLVAGFVQDEWRARPHLTLSLGLRYEVQLSAQPPVHNPAPVLAAAGIDTSALPTDTNNFAPRAGLAWTPWGREAWVVRAGYGIFYSPTIALLLARAHFQNGISVQPRTFAFGTPAALLIPAYPNTICGPPDPSGLPPSCAAPALGAGNPVITPFARDHIEPYVQQWNLSVEVALLKDLAVSVSYLGAKGSRLARTRDVNLATPTVTTTIGIANTTELLSFQRFVPPRPIAGFDRALVFESNASSSYHGLAVQVNKRFSRNFQLLASYTLGKVIDDNPNQYAANPSALDAIVISDPSDPRADRGPGSNDQRHRFVCSG
ncbi:MAG: carboxypeptidase regulatory-like domain-containing protein, partial [Acidobacteria bacterium]|nr:carboxypeptidase regulatory-like domain-containing protein [Acidobacteriota bacterium]